MFINCRSVRFVFFLCLSIITIYLLLSLSNPKKLSNNIRNYTKVLPQVIKKGAVNEANVLSNNNVVKSIKQRGKYWVLYNFIQATISFNYYETITLSTPSDYRFLDNIEKLVPVWNGPISICLYAPGYDFYKTLESLAYLRNCQTDLIKQFVTFHIFFDMDHIPKVQGEQTISTAYIDQYNCTKGPPYVNQSDEDMYKSKNKLLFPINVARNVAREAAQTYFVFPSDIELFPTPDFITKFLELYKRKPGLFEKDQRNVFVLPVFEILENQTIPKTKNELQQLYNEKKAFLFHKRICSLCHKIPKFEQWIKTNDINNNEVDIFTIGKRYNSNRFWEPFFVLTNKEPMFDERLTWEASFNKMCEAFALCLLNYNFVILDNAFVTHKPGVKTKNVQSKKYRKEINETKEILRDIRDELIALYGDNPKCTIAYKL